MKFLKKLFKGQPALPPVSSTPSLKQTPRSPVHPPKIQLDAACISTNKQQFKKIVEKVSIPSKFNFKAEAALLRTKLLHSSNQIETDKMSNILWGFVVGTIGRDDIFQNMLKNECFCFRIARDQEINSLRSLRKRCMDSLVVFWDQNNCQYQLEEIWLSKQKLICVVGDWEDVLVFLKRAQEMMVKSFGDCQLCRFADRMLFNLTVFRGRFIIQFQSQAQFTEQFIECLKTKFQGLRSVEFLELMLNRITVSEYRQIRQVSEGKASIKSKIQGYLSDFEKEIQERKKREEIMRVNRLLAVEAEKERQKVKQENLKRNEQQDNDWEIEYFSKRDSKIETRDSNGSRIVQNQNLHYYFIQEHENNSCSSEDNNSLEARSSEVDGHQRTRSRSCRFFRQCLDADLDDEFFEKY